MVRDADAVTAVHALLARHAVTDVHATLNDEVIIAHMAVAVAEEMLQTQFFEWRHDRSGSGPVHRTDSYSLPRSVAAGVAFVDNTIRLPTVPTSSRRRLRPRPSKSAPDVSAPSRGQSPSPGSAPTCEAEGEETPCVISTYYGVDDSVVADVSSTRCVIEWVAGYLHTDLSVRRWEGRREKGRGRGGGMRSKVIHLGDSPCYCAA